MSDFKNLKQGLDAKSKNIIKPPEHILPKEELETLYAGAGEVLDELERVFYEDGSDLAVYEKWLRKESE